MELSATNAMKTHDVSARPRLARKVQRPCREAREYLDEIVQEAEL